MKHAWEDCLTDVDRIVIEKGHYGQPRGFGKKPLLLIIDLQPNYIGADKPITISGLDKDGNILEAQEGYRPSSEIKMHLRCYDKREDVFSVIHAHPPGATGFAVATFIPSSTLVPGQSRSSLVTSSYCASGVMM